MAVASQQVFHPCLKTRLRKWTDRYPALVAVVRNPSCRLVLDNQECATSDALRKWFTACRDGPAKVATITDKLEPKPAKAEDNIGRVF